MRWRRPEPSSTHAVTPKTLTSPHVPPAAQSPSRPPLPPAPSINSSTTPASPPPAIPKRRPRYIKQKVLSLHKPAIREIHTKRQLHPPRRALIRRIKRRIRTRHKSPRQTVIAPHCRAPFSPTYILAPNRFTPPPGQRERRPSFSTAAQCEYGAVYRDSALVLQGGQERTGRRLGAELAGRRRAQGGKLVPDRHTARSRSRTVLPGRPPGRGERREVSDFRAWLRSQEQAQLYCSVTS
jgi:hypothetical protein